MKQKERPPAYLKKPLLKNLGAERWLEDQDKLWRCPDCRTEFTRYAVNCLKCDRALEEIKGFKSEFDGSIFG